MEQRKLRLQEVGWFKDAKQVWDIQKQYFAGLLASRIKRGPNAISRLYDFHRYLDIGPTEKDYEQLPHNGGNDAVWELEGVIAGCLLTEAQQAELEHRSLPHLEKN